MMTIPFLKPSLPGLKGLPRRLAQIERSGRFSNFGPLSVRFETELGAMIEGGHGDEDESCRPCVTVCNATIGLMVAIRAVIRAPMGVAAGSGRPRYALMPAFTFAAAAHAAQWCGLTPLFCDIDPLNWNASAAAEDELIARHGADIAVIVPYASFGGCLDIARYARLSDETGIPVVVDAAASLGALDAAGRPFGAGAPFPIVFSMHATKGFGIGEGGVIYSADRDLVGRLRRMTNFGFEDSRAAVMPGLNGKLDEVSAAIALQRLDGYEASVAHLSRLAARYRQSLPGWTFQAATGRRQPHAFMPVLLPADLPASRGAVIEALARAGIGAAHYFSPHVAEQPLFRHSSLRGPLTVTTLIGRRILALPLWQGMTLSMVDSVCRELCDIVEQHREPAGEVGGFDAAEMVRVDEGARLARLTPNAGV